MLTLRHPLQTLHQWLQSASLAVRDNVGNIDAHILRTLQKGPVADKDVPKLVQDIATWFSAEYQGKHDPRKSFIGSHGEDPSHVAAGTNHINVIKAMIDAGLRVSKKNDLGNTATHIAATIGSDDLIKILASAAARAGRNKDGFLPADDAAEYEHANVVRALHIVGAPIDQDHKTAGTSIVRAISKKNPDLLRAFLECGANPAQIDAKGNTLAHHVVESDCAENLAVLNEFQAPLDKYKIDPINGSFHGLTPIWRAVEKNNLEMTKALINYGVNTTHAVAFDTLLHHAARNSDNPQMIQALIEGGTPVHVHGGKGLTEIHQAVVAGHANILDILDEYDPKRNTDNKLLSARDNAYITPLMYAQAFLTKADKDQKPRYQNVIDTLERLLGAQAAADLQHVEKVPRPQVA